MQSQDTPREPRPENEMIDDRPRRVPCPECKGTGTMPATRFTLGRICILCRGKGVVSDTLAGQWKRVGE